MKSRSVRVHFLFLFYAGLGLSCASGVAQADRFVTTVDTSSSIRTTSTLNGHGSPQTKNSSKFDDTKEPLIFSYLLRSDFVVRARADSHSFVGLRYRLNRDSSRVDLGESVAAFVYSFSTERVVCSKSSLRSSRVVTRTMFKKFEVFIVSRDRFYEFYNDGGEYLIFLEQIPAEEKLWKTYEVGRDGKYYRAVKGAVSIFGSGGVHDGPPKAIINLKSVTYAPLIKRIEALCGALSPSIASEKIRNLKVLAKSPDPEIRENAEYAIHWFSSNKSR